MSDQNTPKASPKVKPPFIPAPASVSQDLQRRIDFLTAQLAGGRFLVKALELELKEVKAERDKLAGIGIECGCGEADCTADADNLRDALAHIRRLIAAGDSMVEIVNGTYCIDKPPALIAWEKAKKGQLP